MAFIEAMKAQTKVRNTVQRELMSSDYLSPKIFQVQIEQVSLIKVNPNTIQAIKLPT